MSATITIKHRFTGAVLYTHETTQERIDSGLAMRDAMEKATASRANLSGAKLSGADLSRANLSGSDLSGADLSGANLHGANLSGSDLYGADLHGADLHGADLHGANLSEADLYGADLHGADLHGANLYGANLSGANLSGALVKGLKLVGARPFLAIGPIGSESRTIYIWLTESGVRVRAGCFFGSRDEFAAQVSETHGDNEHAQEYGACLPLIDMHTKLWMPAVEVDA